jgi:choline dehydrogenase-like flavoprotein
MSHIHADTDVIDHEAVTRKTYDVVIVGSGVSGSILANEVSRSGFSVLVLEAGPGKDLTISEYESYVSRYYAAASKDNNAPYAKNPNAPMPRSTETKRLQPGRPDSDGYLVQNGPFPLDSTYTRVTGGTTRHWEGKALRMLPEDFETYTRFGQGRDWPIAYETLKPYYRKAERELGVSADVEDQTYLGIEFEPDYVFPMRGLPKSYLDQLIARDLDDTEVVLAGEAYRLKVRATPQARNGIPNPDYDRGKGYVPVGAVSAHQAEMGQRCQGNINCTPICPAQAKYDARKTLAKAIETGRVDMLPQAVASRIRVDPANGRVTGVEYKAYRARQSTGVSTGTAHGRIFIIAANAVETPRLLLASDLPSTSGLVGRNLMDHAYLLSWGLMPEVAGTGRGTQSTSGIEDLRGGSFRSRQAAFRVGIHNEGWGWATGSPYSDLLDLVENKNKYGAALQRGLVDRISRQLLLAFMVELPPDPSNRITVDPSYKDGIGNLRPVLSFNISDYTMRGVAFARELSRRIYRRLGAEDYTTYDPMDYGYVSYQGQGYVIRGGNHWAGTHVMGTTPRNSVVDENQRSWDHENLYLVGAGSMPTIGTANTTLTLSALCFKSAECIVRELKDFAAADVAAN